MQLSEEQLKEIEQFGSRGYTGKEVAVILGITPEKFEMILLDDNHPGTMAYLKGLLSAQLDLRNAVFNSAISGSSPAQTEMKGYFNQAISYLKELRGDA